jgi:hypothetical protein
VRIADDDDESLVAIEEIGQFWHRRAERQVLSQVETRGVITAASDGK